MKQNERIVSRIKIIRESGEWSGAKKTEMNVKCYRRCREKFYDLGNVHGCNNGISGINGKEYQNNCHSIMNTTDLTHTNVRHIYEIGVRTRWDLRIGNNRLGESFMEILVVHWWRKSHQSSTHEGLRLPILYCVLVRFSKPPNRTMHGNQDWDGYARNTETLTKSTASLWNSSGIFSKDSIRCSTVKKSNVYCSD